MQHRDLRPSRGIHQEGQVVRRLGSGLLLGSRDGGQAASRYSMYAPAAAIHTSMSWIACDMA